MLLLVVSESGWVYTFTTDKFKPLVKEDEFGNLSQGQKLIAACLVRLFAILEFLSWSVADLIYDLLGNARKINQLWTIIESK